MITNKICKKHVMHVGFFFISSVLVLVSFKTAYATSLRHQVREGVGRGLDKERDALLHFKAYIHKDPFGYLSTWIADEEETNYDCCKWSGVMCNNQTGHVTILDLKHGDLQGTISPLLFSLSHLNRLDLSFNFFNGTIPRSISKATRLRYLNLGWNAFNGPIPNTIGSMNQLRHVYLSYNFLSGTIPRSIGSLNHLSCLYLSYNSFSGTIPLELGNLTNLQELSLEYMGDSTIKNLDWLSNLSQLENLRMDGISFAKENNWVNTILGLKKLSFLSLDACDLSQVMHPHSYSSVNSSSSSSIFSLFLGNNNLNSSMYRWLTPLTSNRLVDLDLSHNKLDGIPKSLGNLCSLKFLYFHDNSVPVKFSDFLNNLSGCTSSTLQTLLASGSQFMGLLSDDILKFSSLESLVLSNNHLNGTISEKVWELPNLQNLRVSSNSFQGAISNNIGKSKLLNLDLSNNSLEGIPSEARMSNLSYVQYIDLSSCKLGPGFPKWIQTLKNLTYVDIANTRISDTIPTEFWNTWPSRLTYLNLSSNNITGKVKDLLTNFDPQFSMLDLSSNNFYGSILDVPSNLETLDLSKNKFCGEISFLCQITGGFFYFLDLSHNSFTGKIPDCLWHFKELKVLSLGHNSLSGRLPTSIGYLTNLEVLYLYNNNFSEELPLSLKKCTKLAFLDLGVNKFSGYLPVWIGSNLLGLYALSLTSNNFFGTIPLQLCQLANLQILDLSTNNIYGAIPSCFYNLTAIVRDGFSSYQNVHYYYCSTDICETKGGVRSSGQFVDHAIIKWQGSIREFINNLEFLKSIDLSSNNLTGQIPYELTSLYGLIALNLSNNFILGEIPPNIGEMKMLLTLDLSRNNLSGGLPSSISKMSSLNYLDVSYNNLSGRIPSGTQLQSFEPSRYTGNPGLCGLPLSKYCQGDNELEVPPLVGESKDNKEGIDDIQRWFYISGAIGFATGFWIACGVLLVNRRGRNAFSLFLDSLKDWVYIKLIVSIAKLQRTAYL